MLYCCCFLCNSFLFFSIYDFFGVLFFFQASTHARTRLRTRLSTYTYEDRKQETYKHYDHYHIFCNALFSLGWNNHVIPSTDTVAPPPLPSVVQPPSSAYVHFTPPHITLQQTRLRKCQPPLPILSGDLFVYIHIYAKHITDAFFVHNPTLIICIHSKNTGAFIHYTRKHICLQAEFFYLLLL